MKKDYWVHRQSRFLPGGTFCSNAQRSNCNGPAYYNLGTLMTKDSDLQVDIPYDVITSVKLMKGVLTSTILFKVQHWSIKAN